MNFTPHEAAATARNKNGKYYNFMVLVSPAFILTLTLAREGSGERARDSLSSFP